MKQVIVMRKDLNMRKGKMIAQGSHASLANVLDIQKSDNEKFKKDLNIWLSESFRKITLYVTSEEELINIYENAKKANLNVALITDKGDTEFHGVPTKTCLSIGPHLNEEIDPITSELKLL